MEIYGRKLLDGERQKIEVDFDDLVFLVDGEEIAISLYRARIEGIVEVRANHGILVLLPRAANVIQVENRR